MNALLTDILSYAVKEDASDVHLTVGQKPRARVHGRMVTLDAFPPLMADPVMDVVPQHVKKDFEEGRSHELDFALENSVGRFRVNVFRENRGISAVFRHIPERIMTLEELGHPPAIRKVIDLRRGLVLITGPAGSGKTTTLASLICEMSRRFPYRIITIEDPIEFVYESGFSLISQREVGVHTTSFASALRSALREDPDVILVGEMRDLETMSLAIKGALTGHLVLSTMHTISASKTIDRLIEVFPPEQQNQVRTDFADVIECIVSQLLIPRKDGKGRVLAYEVMFANTAIRNLIREGKTYQIDSIMEMSRLDGMVCLDDCLEKLLNMGVISVEQAYVRAKNRERFMSREKSLTSVVSLLSGEA